MHYIFYIKDTNKSATLTPWWFIQVLLLLVVVLNTMNYPGSEFLKNEFKFIWWSKVDVNNTPLKF